MDKSFVTPKKDCNVKININNGSHKFSLKPFTSDLLSPPPKKRIKRTISHTTPKDQRLLSQYFHSAANNIKKELFKEHPVIDIPPSNTSSSPKTDLDHYESLDKMQAIADSLDKVPNITPCEETFESIEQTSEGIEEMLDSFHISDMLSGFVHNFNVMVSQNCLHTALDVVTMLPSQVPPQNVIQCIIQKMILDNVDRRLAVNSVLTLLRQLQIYTPCNSSTQNYYYNILLHIRGEYAKVIWNSLSDIISCCFEKCNLVCTQEQYHRVRLKSEGNPLLVLRYVVDIVKKDYEEMETYSSTTSPLKINSATRTLIYRIIWPTGNNNSMSNAGRCLVRFICDILSSDDITGCRTSLLHLLAELLCLMVECATTCSNEVKPLDNIHCVVLEEVLREICVSENMYIKESLKAFLEYIDIQWLRMRICESLMNRIILDRIYTKSQLTLRKVVFKYMLLSSNGKDIAQKITPQKQTRPKRKSKVPEEPDVSAADKGGNTSLHIAVEKNSIDIADLLLNYSGNGEKLAFAVNKKGTRPVDLIESEEMRTLFQKYIAYIKNDGRGQLHPSACIYLAPEIEKRITPNITDLNDLRIYIECLQLLLADYIDFFQLQELAADPIMTKNNLESSVKVHMLHNLKCKPSINDVISCCDDVIILDNLPHLLKRFCTGIQNSCSQGNEIGNEMQSLYCLRQLLK